MRLQSAALARRRPSCSRSAPSGTILALAACCACGLLEKSPATTTPGQTKLVGQIGTHDFTAQSGAYGRLGPSLQLTFSSTGNACGNFVAPTGVMLSVVLDDYALDPNGTALPGVGTYPVFDPNGLFDPNSQKVADVMAAVVQPPDLQAASHGSVTLGTAFVATGKPLQGSLSIGNANDMQIGGLFVAGWCAAMDAPDP